MVNYKQRDDKYQLLKEIEKECFIYLTFEWIWNCRGNSSLKLGWFVRSKNIGLDNALFFCLFKSFFLKYGFAI